MTVDQEYTSSDEAAEEAAFESGFNATEEAAVTPDTPQPEPIPEPEPEVPVAPGLTNDDLKAMFEAERLENQKARDKLFGKIGDLQQRLETARTKTSGISPKARERLTADFPELAEMLFDGDPTDEPVFQAPAPQQVAPGPEVEQTQTLERRFLTRDHRDWETIVVSPEFDAWTANLPQSDQHTLNSTWDADFVSAKITEYKAWQSSKQAAAVKKQDRLDAAVIPRGVPRDSIAHDTDDEEAAMLKAFGKR